MTKQLRWGASIVCITVTSVSVIGWLASHQYKQLADVIPFEPLLFFLSILDLLGIGFNFWKDQQEAEKVQQLKAHISDEAKATEGHLLVREVITECAADERAEQLKQHVSFEAEQIKQIIGKSGNQSSQSRPPEQDFELGEIDFQILVELWRFLRYEVIESLLRGYANGHILDSLIDKIDVYEDYRQHPKYHLADEELEKKLQELDWALYNVTQRGSLLFAYPDPPNDHYVPIYKIRGGSSKDYEAGFIEYDDFVKGEVLHAIKIYGEFLELLKRRRLLQVLLWSSIPKEVDSEGKQE